MGGRSARQGRRPGLWRGLRTLGGQRLGKFGQHLIEGQHRVGQPCGHCVLAEVHGSFGGAHGIHIQLAHLGNLRREDSVEPVDFALQRTRRLRAQGFVRREIVLVATGKNSGVVQPVLGILDGLIDVQRDHADGAHTGGLRQRQTLAGSGNGVGGRVRGIVGVCPDRLDPAGGADALGQLEHAARFAAGRIQIEQDARHLRIGQRSLQPGFQFVVGHQARSGIEAQRAFDQSAEHRNDGDARLRKRPRLLGFWDGKGHVPVGQADA